MLYDHRHHAGNAGDVWKHFILAEAVRFLISGRAKLLYVESHVGFPEYSLHKPGEWQGGIGRCWEHLEALERFCYFKILASMNQTALTRYPGSARLVEAICRSFGIAIDAQLYDTNPEVAAAWRDNGWAAFHLEDGFSAASSLLARSDTGLLLIDPPFIDSRDFDKAKDLLQTAERSGWTVLSWHIPDVENALKSEGLVREYCLRFGQAGLDGGSWEGAVIEVAGDWQLQSYIAGQSKKFKELLSPSEAI